MKTTIDIADALLAEARRRAALRGTTIRALVEEGLRHVLGERTGARDFRLRDGSFEGRGLQPGFRDAGWDELRTAIYEDRGA